MDDKKTQSNIEISMDPDTTPILYTDNVFMTTNEDGLTLNIGQTVGPNQVRVVTRIGMSRVHAKKVLKELGTLLVITEESTETGKKKKN